MSDDAELLDLAVQAARLGGSLLRERAARGVQADVSSKSTPTDLVSEADLAAEEAIRGLLAARRPDDGFLGEEGGGGEGESGLVWVVDPLDGTINFLFGLPQWCVSVAVRDRDGTIAGAVYDPNREELFTAMRDGAAELHRPGEDPRPLRGRAADPGAAGSGAPADGAAALSSALIATGFAYDARVRAAQARVIARVAGSVRDLRRVGSAALDLCWTAAGRYDGYYERTVKEWDIAAGALICRRAGLQVLDLPVHEELPWGIVVARPALARPLLELVGGE